jgi:hypothetical protein
MSSTDERGVVAVEDGWVDGIVCAVFRKNRGGGCWSRRIDRETERGADQIKLGQIRMPTRLTVCVCRGAGMKGPG